MDLQLLLMLIGGHYLADFALQTQFMADTKQRAFVDAIGFHSLTAHAAIHGLITGLLSQSLSVALIVFVTHWVIDFGKSSMLLDDKFPHTRGSRKSGQKYGLYGINIDQALHLLVILMNVLFVI